MYLLLNNTFRGELSPKILLVIGRIEGIVKNGKNYMKRYKTLPLSEQVSTPQIAYKLVFRLLNINSKTPFSNFT